MSNPFFTLDDIYGPDELKNEMLLKIAPLFAWMEEAREIIQDTAAGNKLSETSGTLLSRYQHLRERARECLAKWPGGEK